jgi:hypothetical protein
LFIFWVDFHRFCILAFLNKLRVYLQVIAYNIEENVAVHQLFADF